MTYKINYCISFGMKQRPSWLMWRCFDASRLTSFGLSAVCCQGNQGKPESFPPNWPLKEDRRQKSGQGWLPRPLLLLFTFGAASIVAMFSVQTYSRQLRAAEPAAAADKIVAGQSVYSPSRVGAWEPGVRVDSQSSSLGVWPLQVDLLSWSGSN